MSLRERLIEAGARVLADHYLPEEPPDGVWMYYEDEAGAVLDAVLGVLSDEFPDGDEASLIAALRDTETDVGLTEEGTE